MIFTADETVSSHLIGPTQPKILKTNGDHEEAWTRMPSLRATWAQLIDTFILETDNSAPLLAANIGFMPDWNGRCDDHVNLFCFERCADGQESAATGVSTVVARTRGSEEPPAEKKRKVKSSRHQAIGDMLTGCS